MSSKTILASILFCLISSYPIATSDIITSKPSAITGLKIPINAPKNSTATIPVTASTSKLSTTQTPTATNSTTPTNSTTQTSTPTNSTTHRKISTTQTPTQTTQSPNSTITTTVSRGTSTSTQNATSSNASTEHTSPSTTPLMPTLPPNEPDVPENPWNVSVNGSVCILAKFGATLKINYTNSRHETVMTGFNIPSNATVNKEKSSCNLKGTQVLVLNFDDQNQWMGSISFTFIKTNDSIFAQSVKLVYNLTEELFPNYVNPKDYNKMVTAVNKNLTLFSVIKSHSYECKSETKAPLKNRDTSIETEPELDIIKAQVQAFGESKGFSEAIECKEDPTDDKEIPSTVPIIVGAALGALVLIVLIAFFIGRRRNSRISYSSM